MLIYVFIVYIKTIRYLKLLLIKISSLKLLKKNLTLVALRKLLKSLVLMRVNLQLTKAD